MAAIRSPTVTGDPVTPPASGTRTNRYTYATQYNYDHHRYHNAYVVLVLVPDHTPRLSTFLWPIIVIIIMLLLITGSLLLIIMIVLRPRVPAFCVTVSLSDYSVSTSASASNSVTATWLLNLRVVNSNHRIPITYENIVSSIAYGGELLATTSMRPFYQGTRHTTDLKVGFTDKDYNVSLETANGMERDRMGPGIVGFAVRARALTKFKTNGLWWLRAWMVLVICLRIPVSFTWNATGGAGMSGQLSGRERECEALIE